MRLRLHPPTGRPGQDEINRTAPETRLYAADELVSLAVFEDTDVDGSTHPAAARATRQATAPIEHINLSPTNRQAHEIFHMVEAGELDLDPPYQRGQARAALREAVKGWAECALAAIEDAQMPGSALPADAVRALMRHATSEAARAQCTLSAEWTQELRAALGQVLSNPLGASGGALRPAAVFCRTLVKIMNDAYGYQGTAS